MTTLLRVQDVGKRYVTRGSGLFRRAEPVEHWALRHVDLEVRAGEVVAVIGRNGAGKSTLLKLGTGVTQPTEGAVLRVDRVAPLIEVGAGFHPDLTGRDNVLVNARLLGLTRKEVAGRFDEIVAFAEIEHAIDKPVQTYSSGMFMRLAFSVAIHTRPQLLLVDEVLAVGDMPFQTRCLDRIRTLRDEGVGILFVSHNLAAVQDISTRAVLIEGGGLRMEGATSDVIGAYHLALADSGSTVPGSEAVGSAAGEVLAMLACQMVDLEGVSCQTWEPGTDVVVRVRLRALRDTPQSLFGFQVHSEAAGAMMRWNNEQDTHLPSLVAGEEIDVELGLTLALGSGGYGLDLAVVSADWRSVLLNRPQVLQFAVAHRPGARGLVDLLPRLSFARSNED
jgi:ABC-type polysaccharide/polyol phosphate transport system ATPase subunit